jgi:hypothetical protein
MANQIATSDMVALLDEVIRGTDISCTLSKGLRKFEMDDEAAERSGDTMFLPQEFRFNVQDGIVSSAADFQDLIDRMIPINLEKSKRILATISSKQLRDPRLMKMAAQGMTRDLKNSIDLECFTTMINNATMVQTSLVDFKQGDAVLAGVLMDDSGLTGYEKQLVLSTPHYAQIATELGQIVRTQTNLTAFEKAQIPGVADFETSKASYRLNLAANVVANVTVNGNQSHTIATKNSDGFYQDNRVMTLALTNATAANMPVGTKFTIADIFRVHPDTKVSTEQLMTFTVKTAVNAAPSIQPAIVISGPYQNCSAQAGTGKAVVMVNNTIDAPSLFFTPESTVLVPGNLPVSPLTENKNIGFVDGVTEQGIPVRMTYEHDFHTEQTNIKMLAFFDVQVINPEQVGVILANQS